ncbi:MAG TPA: hypothetical protein PK819_07065, partial [Thermomicrobiales bacterium]|nr:hypothetical protein [Thermomicrobiales bacterium]
MHHIITRLTSFIITAAILLGLAPAFVQPGAVAAQTDALTQKEFRTLIRKAEAKDPVYGPEDGELDADPDKVSLAYADVDLTDLLIEATFTNPQADDDHPFDIGLQIRSSK